MVGPRPAELEALIERRRRTGADLFDEVWEGEYHMAPAPSAAHALLDQQLAVLLEPLATAAGLVASGSFNLGEPENFRVPDRGLHRRPPSGVWVPTAALVVEIVSPDDETWDKPGFYAAHHVDEILIVDPAERVVVWLAREDDSYRGVPASGLLGVSSDELAGRIDWPPVS